MGYDYLSFREKAHIIEQYSFSSEKKRMGTIIESQLGKVKNKFFLKNL